MEKLIELLSNIRPDVDFSTAKNLTTDGLLDSFDIVAIVSDLNAAYSISIGVIDLVPENFDSVEAIFKLVQEKMK